MSSGLPVVIEVALNGATRPELNPRECAGHLEGHNAIGVVDLVNRDTEILLF